jgi:hypothetical protein
VLVCLALVLAGCSGGDEQAAGPSTPTSTGPTTTTLAAIGPVSGCEGLGPAPAGGEVTYLSDQRLFAVVPGGSPRCLLGVPPGAAAPAWGGKADRVLLAPEGAQVGDKTVLLGLLNREETAEWSQPTGTSVLILREGKLTKRRIDTGAFHDISFLHRHDEAVYHPAGLHIVSVGTDLSDRYGVFLASNEGKDVREVAVAETANELVSPSWGSGSTLFFGAEHAGNPPGDRYHIHYRPNDPGPLFKIPVDGPVARVIASPFDDLVTAETGPCPGRGTRTVDLGQVTSFTDDVPDVPVVTVDVGAAETEPVGWLPGGRLVVLGRPRCELPGTLWIVPVSPAGPPEHVADKVASAAVRVPLPEPGPAPFEAGGIEPGEA